MLPRNLNQRLKHKGIKHLVQCHYILPQYRNVKDPTFHQFVVFSILELETDTIAPTFAECNNCGIVHKVIDICKSEIVTGREDLRSQISIADISHSIPSSLFELLQSYDRELPDYQHAQFIIEYDNWGDYIILTKEEVDDYVQGKLVKFISQDKFRVESYTQKKVV